MKNVNCLFIRYLGSSANRHHVLQRASGEFWDGDSWTRILDCAKIFRVHKDAQRACAALQYEQYKGLPMRSFKIVMSVTLVADNVEDISEEALKTYISNSMRIDMESSLFGDGPVQGSFVQGRLILSTLKETESPRERF